MNNNYPDDINNYCSNPRCPLYNDPPECPECGDELELDADGNSQCTNEYCIESPFYTEN